MVVKIFAMIGLAFAAATVCGCNCACMNEDAAEYSAISENPQHNPQPGAETPSSGEAYRGYSNTSNAGTSTANPSAQTGSNSSTPTTTPTR